MRIAGFIKTTLLDWDGKVACTMYLPGCDFRCHYCHNREIVLHPDESEALDETAVFEYLEANSDFIDGVVISGGEPTLQKDLVKLIRRIRSLGLMVKIDTNGNHPDVLDDLIGAGLVDMIAMDIKAPLTDERYSDITEVKIDADRIRRSIKLIMESGIDYEFRTTLVPVFIKPEDIESISKDIEGAKCYCLHQFRPKICLDKTFEVVDPYDESVVLEMAAIAKKHVRQVKVRGI